jgi:glycosyltransferase involved in cell wall biosynthesis
LCFDLHVKDSVQFLDWKSKEELSLIFHNSDAFVLFSDAETQAVVLLESLCCGIPVISSKCGAPEEFINSKNGLLVDIRNEEQLYQAMLSLAKNKTLYISSEIRNSVKDMVSEKSVAEKFMRMYKDVLKIK